MSNANVFISSPQDGQMTTTDAGGLYSVSIQTEGELWMHVRPDLSTRLTQANLWMDGVSASLIQNFTVTNGYLLDLGLTASGAPLTEPTWLKVQPLIEPLPERQWYVLDWQESTARYQAVLPPDAYYVTVPSPPASYYRTSQPFDLRASDQIADLALAAAYVHPYSYDPPDASKITFSAVDDLGEATVSGAAGAALPLAHLLLVNLNSNHQAHTTTESDGSFSARIYAPPGSAVMLKHGPPEERWHNVDQGVAEGFNPLPGTIINLPHTHTGDPGELPFAAAGGIAILADDPAETRNYVGAAWAISGTLGPVVVEGQWTRVLNGTYDGELTPGLYLGGLNWTHPTLGDLDADGDLELLVGERSGHLVLYRNLGSAALPDWQFETAAYAGVDTGWWAYPALADVTGDGAPDLFVGAGDGTVSVYYNDGAPSQALWPASPDASLSAGENAAPTLADLDDDGDLDLFVGHMGSTLYHFENTGTFTNPAWTQRTDSYGGISETEQEGIQPALIDLDGDDDLDLLIGRCGNLLWYRNAGSTWTRVASDPIGYGGGSCATSPGVGDWDGDGDDDLVTGEHWGVLRFFRNGGPPTWTEQDLIFPFDLAGDSAPALADWDDDGDLDLLLGQAHGQVYQYTNDGSAATPDWRPDDVLLTLPWTDHSHAFPTLADVDGDDDYDLFIGEGGWPPETGMGGNVHYYRNDGMPAAPAWTLVVTNFLGLDVGGWSTPVFVDIDADADLDLFVGDEAGTLTFVQNTGTPLTPTWAAPVQPYAGLDLGAYSAPSFFDLDQDGDMDMLVGLESGSLAYVRNTGSTMLTTSGAADSPAWELVSTTHPDIDVGERTTPTAADMHGDGQPDLLIGDGDGGQPITYRLEPFLPMISFTDRRMPTPPLIPFDLPGGQLRVVIREPDGTIRDLGRESLAQSFNRTKTTRAGLDLNSGTVQLEDVYSLQAASDRFRVALAQYGHHVITMTGVISDVWGNGYAGGGIYDLWIAHPLDIDPGVLPGTPLAVGDAFNPALQVYPRVPAQVNLSLTLYPYSDPLQAITHTLNGQANIYGAFSPSPPAPRLSYPGEYRVDLTAIYTDTDGTLYMGAMTWGGIVMTPENEAQLVAHGRRGVDSLSSIPTHWFVSCRDLPIPPGAVSHTLNAYFNGDIVWSRMADAPGECPAGVSSGGDSLILGASVQDSVGSVKIAVQARANRMHPGTAAPGDLAERLAKDEIPLFSSTRSGRPVQLAPDDVDQIAYSYRYSQRPGVRVRELVAEDNQSGGYWRLDTLYDDQLGVGVQGDLVNDFKFQYVGAVYRDLDSGRNEYVGQGSGWIFIPDDDPAGSRVMPPFAGYGGWTDEGGPILTLKGEDVHIFILPTGVQPGAVLQVGDTFRFAGHVMPTLDSQVAVTLTAPGGTQYLGGGQANRVGYFYDPDDDVIMNEPGAWSVDVRVWHEGQCSGGATSPPYPTGDVLGSENGRYWFYVVAGDSSRLNVSAPPPGFLSFGDTVTPIVISGILPSGLSSATLDYTIRMPGYILTHGQATLNANNIQYPISNPYQITFDPATLQQDFPNLDLLGRDEHRAGLADTFAIGLLLRGQKDGSAVYQANTLTFQGEQVFVRNTAPDYKLYLPLIVKRG